MKFMRCCIVGAAVGGFLGALGGKQDKPPSGDCPPPAR